MQPLPRLIRQIGLAMVVILTSCYPCIATPHWYYSYELEQERRSEHKLIQQHALIRSTEDWYTTLEYSHDEQARKNSEAWEWKLGKLWRLSNQNHLKLEHKLALPQPDTGIYAELLLAGHRHITPDFKLLLETVLVYLKEDKADLYRHSGKVELSYFHHKDQWPANRSWLHIFKTELNAARNIQAADYYRVSTLEASYQPKIMLNQQLSLKFLLAMGYDFNQEDEYPSAGVKLKYRF